MGKERALQAGSAEAAQSGPRVIEAKGVSLTFATADGPDSLDVLPALLGESPKGREHLIEQGAGLSVRQGAWKYIEPGQGPKVSANTNTETGRSP